MYAVYKAITTIDPFPTVQIMMSLGSKVGINWNKLWLWGRLASIHDSVRLDEL